LIFWTPVPEAAKHAQVDADAFTDLGNVFADSCQFVLAAEPWWEAAWPSHRSSLPPVKKGIASAK
jgi:hypothetical protein